MTTGRTTAGDQTASRPAPGRTPPARTPARPAPPAPGNRAVGRMLAAEAGRSDSRGLDAAVRSTMEARFGQDFGSVRVHTGPAATVLAGRHRARALTVGDDIVFRPGEYAPSTPEGRRSIAHELAHVVQQRRGGPDVGDGPLESDAEQAARAFVADPTRPIRVRESAPQRVSRQADGPDGAPVPDGPAWIDAVVEGVVSAAVAGPAGPLAGLMSAAMRGFVAEMVHRLSWTEVGAFADEMRKMDTVAFSAGYAAGTVAGLASPVTDLFDLVKLAVELPIAAGRIALHIGEDPQWFAKETSEISAALMAWVDSLALEKATLDVASIAALVQVAGGKMREGAAWAGHTAARELVTTMTGGGTAAKDSWASGLLLGNASRVRGYNIGHAVGAVASNVLIFVLTEGVGEAIVQVAAWIGKLHKALGTVAEIVATLGKVIGYVDRVVNTIAGAVLKPFAKLLKPLTDVMVRLRAMLRRLLGVAEKGAATSAATAGAKAVEKKLTAPAVPEKKVAAPVVSETKVAAPTVSEPAPAVVTEPAPPVTAPDTPAPASGGPHPSAAEPSTPTAPAAEPAIAPPPPATGQHTSPESPASAGSVTPAQAPDPAPAPPPTTAEPAAPAHGEQLPQVAGAEEVRVTSQAEYEQRLAHTFPQHSFDVALSTVEDIGRTTARTVVQDPAFVAALQQGRFTQAGTMFHNEAAVQGRLLAPTMPPGYRARFELTVQSGKGGSRLDILIEDPAGRVLEVDWKTTGRSAMKSSGQMAKHAQQTATFLGTGVTEQQSKSWVDFVRPLLPNIPWK